MTEPQRNKDIELNKQCRQSYMTNKHDAQSVSQLSRSISADIVVGVKKASNTNDTPEDDITDDGDDSTSTKRRAESDGVGDFITNLRKKASEKE